MQKFQATIRKLFLVSQRFLSDVHFTSVEAPAAGIRLFLSKATITGSSFAAGCKSLVWDSLGVGHFCGFTNIAE